MYSNLYAVDVVGKPLSWNMFNVKLESFTVEIFNVVPK